MGLMAYFHQEMPVFQPHVNNISFNNTQNTVCFVYFLGHMIFKCEVTMKY